MFSLINIINGITNTLEISEKIIPLIKSSKNTISLALDKINIPKKNTINNKKITKKEGSDSSTLTFFQ